MYGLSNYTILREDDPLISYCKREFKDDWEAAYLQYYKKDDNSIIAILKEKISNFRMNWKEIFPVEINGLERRLSECSNLYEVEEIHRKWDRRHERNGLAA